MLSPLISFSLFTLLFVLECSTQKLLVSFPSELASNFKNNTIAVNSSPIGFKPKAGSLHGKLLLAQPLNACTDIKQVSFQQQQDVFIMADDAGCLQSVKAHSIANSGAYVGIIKKNINNTLHDRQIDLVHIPILQIEPSDFNILQGYLNTNPNAQISLLADFNTNTELSKINMEFWLSPTNTKAYTYILQFKNFIKNQQDKISFHPRFALHSQTTRKQYIGCFSSGRYCPPQLQYQGRAQGSNIVAEALRQIIIADKNMHKWFDYANYYYNRCLKMNEQLWQDGNSNLCSQSAMRSHGIDPTQIFREYNKSFQGNRAQVDSNLYLQEQRQLYIQEKITEFPILLLNGKQYSLQDTQQTKIQICTMMHPDPNKQSQQCQKLTNASLFSTAQIFIGVGIMLAIMVFILVSCKEFIQRKMKIQMKGQVDKTLSQYYRYMQSLEEPDPSAVGRVPLMQQKVQTNQIGSVELSQYKGNNK